MNIVETAGRADGSALTADEMLGDSGGVRLAIGGATVIVSTYVEDNDPAFGPQQVEWTRVEAGATNTLLLMAIGNAGDRDVGWHEAVWRSIVHTEPRSGLRGRFRRR